MTQAAVIRRITVAQHAALILLMDSPRLIDNWLYPCNGISRPTMRVLVRLGLAEMQSLESLNYGIRITREGQLAIGRCWRFEVLTAGGTRWSANSLTFGSREEAEEAGWRKRAAWIAVDKVRAVTDDTPRGEAYVPGSETVQTQEG